MTLLFCDSFDLYGVKADMEQYYDGVDVNTNFSTSLGRFGGGCIAQTSSQDYVQKNLLANETTLIVSFAYKLTSIDPAVRELVKLDDTGTNQCGLDFSSDGAIHALRGTTSIGSSSPGLIQIGDWHWISMKATIDNSAGAVEVYLDNVQVLNLTSVDTQVTGNTYANQVKFGSTASGASQMDDVIVCNDSGAVNNNIIADTRIYALLPDAITAEEDFTSSAGGDNYTFVDEALLTSPDDDTTYVESSTATNTDRYGMQNIVSSPGTIKAVVLKAYAKKDDAGARSIRMISENNTNEDIASDQALTTDYSYYDHVVEVDPDGGGAWLEADVNAMTAGYEVV